MNERYWIYHEVNESLKRTREQFRKATQELYRQSIECKKLSCQLNMLKNQLISLRREIKKAKKLKGKNAQAVFVDELQENRLQIKE